jgi:hypothetical protein
MDHRKRTAATFFLPAPPPDSIPLLLLADTAKPWNVRLSLFLGFFCMLAVQAVGLGLDKNDEKKLLWFQNPHDKSGPGHRHRHRRRPRSATRSSGPVPLLERQFDFASSNDRKPLPNPNTATTTQRYPRITYPSRTSTLRASRHDTALHDTTRHDNYRIHCIIQLLSRHILSTWRSASGNPAIALLHEEYIQYTHSSYAPHPTWRILALLQPRKWLQ